MSNLLTYCQGSDAKRLEPALSQIDAGESEVLQRIIAVMQNVHGPQVHSSFGTIHNPQHVRFPPHKKPGIQVHGDRLSALFGRTHLDLPYIIGMTPEDSQYADFVALYTPPYDFAHRPDVDSQYYKIVREKFPDGGAPSLGSTGGELLQNVFAKPQMIIDCMRERLGLLPEKPIHMLGIAGATPQESQLYFAWHQHRDDPRSAPLFVDY